MTGRSVTKVTLTAPLTSTHRFTNAQGIPPKAHMLESIWSPPSPRGWLKHLCCPRLGSRPHLLPVLQTPPHTHGCHPFWMVHPTSPAPSHGPLSKATLTELPHWPREGNTIILSVQGFPHRQDITGHTSATDPRQTRLLGLDSYVVIAFHLTSVLMGWISWAKPISFLEWDFLLVQGQWDVYVLTNTFQQRFLILFFPFSFCQKKAFFSSLHISFLRSFI